METDNNSVAPDHDNDSGSPIRRPMNAFLIFCKRHRSVVREKHPNLDNRSITRILGDMWAKLGATEKSLYTNLAKQVINYAVHQNKYKARKNNSLVLRPSFIMNVFFQHLKDSKRSHF